MPIGECRPCRRSMSYCLCLAGRLSHCTGRPRTQTVVLAAAGQLSRGAIGAHLSHVRAWLQLLRSGASYGLVSPDAAVL